MVETVQDVPAYNLKCVLLAIVSKQIIHQAGRKTMPAASPIVFQFAMFYFKPHTSIRITAAIIRFKPRASLASRASFLLSRAFN